MKTEQTDGKNADVVALAKKFEADQTAELVKMKDMLTSRGLGPSYPFQLG